MGLIHQGITFLHFDETYYAQKELHQFSHEDISLQHLQNTSLYCDDGALEEIRHSLHNRSSKGITYIGSGNYHYVSYVLLEEINEPFTLILFDNHPDLGLKHDQEPVFSCGSWVYYALKDHPFLQQVIIVGATYEDIPNEPHVLLIPFSKINQQTIHLILQHIPTDLIYISIDKDVLRIKDAETNWDQGQMKLETLTKYLTRLLQMKEVFGLDVCGEVRSSYLDLLKPRELERIKKNEKANLSILETCLSVSPHTLFKA